MRTLGGKDGLAVVCYQDARCDASYGMALDATPGLDMKTEDISPAIGTAVHVEKAALRGDVFENPTLIDSAA